MTLPEIGLSSFGELLKEFRTRRHFTQEQLAKAVGVHRHAVGRWERGDFLPANRTTVLELAKHLHLDDWDTRQLVDASLTAPAPHWLVPLSCNPYFTGREEILEALHTQLGVDHEVGHIQSCALQGLGGVGKTQIALEYAYRYTLEYSATFWIAGETSESVTSSLLHIAETLQLQEREDKDQQRIIAAVQRWLATHGRWLLIWDNVEDMNLLQRFLSPTRSGAILITTRLQALGTFTRGLHLTPMKQEEGMLFLLRRAKALALEATPEQMQWFARSRPAEYAAARALVTILGGLPLALDQVGAYIEETRCGLPTYFDLLRTRRVALLRQRGCASSNHPDPVSITFTVALTATASHHPAVMDLLHVCALLQPDAIPEELFRLGGEQLGKALQAVCRDPLEWDRVVGAGCMYSLLARQSEEQTLSLHLLVQAILLDEMTETEREQWSRRVISALDAVFPEVLPTTEHMVWKQCERLLPHALLCLHRGGTDKGSLVLASLAYKVAQYLQACGQRERAEPFFRQASRIEEQILVTANQEVSFQMAHTYSC